MLNREISEIQPLLEFLRVPTPTAWLEYAASNIPLLLIDHAHCERKAAATAINFMSKYPGKHELVMMMSPLAREELLHFEKVVEIMRKRGINFGPVTSSDYASSMHKYVKSQDVDTRLRDQLIIGAIIEARSCERFYALLPYLNDPELEKFYRSLLKSEARHFENYLKLAHLYGESVAERIDFFLEKEHAFINSEDGMFRFHSGVPVEQTSLA